MEGEIQGLTQVEQCPGRDGVTDLWLGGHCCAGGTRETWHSDVDRGERAPGEGIGQRRAIWLGRREGLDGGRVASAAGAVLVADLLSNLLFCFGHLARVALHPVCVCVCVCACVCMRERGRERERERESNHWVKLPTQTEEFAEVKHGRVH